MPAKNCLITGATSGIGLEASKILAQQGYDLILVSRSESKLSDLSKMEVYVNVNENDIADISIDDLAIVEVDAYDDRNFK